MEVAKADGTSLIRERQLSQNKGLTRKTANIKIKEMSTKTKKTYHREEKRREKGWGDKTGNFFFLEHVFSLSLSQPFYC